MLRMPAPTSLNAFTPSTPWAVTTPRYSLTGRPSIPGVVVTSISIPPCRCLRASGVSDQLRCLLPAGRQQLAASLRPERPDPARSRPAWSGRCRLCLLRPRRRCFQVRLQAGPYPPLLASPCPGDQRVQQPLAGALQEVRTCPSAPASAPVLAVACPSLIAVAGASSPASAAAAAAAGVAESGLVRRRTAAAAAAAAAASTEKPASLRQRGRCGWAGSSRRAAADSQAETVGATLSCRTCPLRSTRGAAQARVPRTRRFAAAPALCANGFM